MQDFIVVDLEATCWETGTSPARMEIIEWGAVRLEPPGWRSVSEFCSFVKPAENPQLSEFCYGLTGINQEDIDSAPGFPISLQAFLDWAGAEPFTWGSWGAYDLEQIRVDCRRHRVPFPEALTRHVNLKKTYCEARGMRPCGMKAALRREGFELTGTHHRALDDARNIARLAGLLLPGLTGNPPTLS